MKHNKGSCTVNKKIQSTVSCLLKRITFYFLDINCIHIMMFTEEKLKYNKYLDVSRL